MSVCCCVVCVFSSQRFQFSARWCENRAVSSRMYLHFQWRQQSIKGEGERERERERECVCVCERESMSEQQMIRHTATSSARKKVYACDEEKFLAFMAKQNCCKKSSKKNKKDKQWSTDVTYRRRSRPTSPLPSKAARPSLSISVSWVLKCRYLKITLWLGIKLMVSHEGNKTMST